MRVILASGSPRRKEILSSIVDEFEVITSEADEHHGNEAPHLIVEELSKRKAIAVWQQEKPVDAIVIGADTVVAFQKMILEKPKDRMDAARMLTMLQGNEHQVYTGVTIITNAHGKMKQVTYSECTNVRIKAMSQSDIQAYVESGESDDKAGSYAIQGIFSKYIEGYDGDYYNVVGLPKESLKEKIHRMLNE